MARLVPNSIVGGIKSGEPGVRPYLAGESLRHHNRHLRHLPGLPDLLPDRNHLLPLDSREFFESVYFLLGNSRRGPRF
jgi:hypothetical protein